MFAILSNRDLRNVRTLNIKGIRDPIKHSSIIIKFRRVLTKQ